MDTVAASHAKEFDNLVKGTNSWNMGIVETASRRGRESEQTCGE